MLQSAAMQKTPFVPKKMGSHLIVSIKEIPYCMMNTDRYVTKSTAPPLPPTMQPLIIMGNSWEGQLLSMMASLNRLIYRHS